jgi:hypothetical protein
MPEWGWILIAVLAVIAVAAIVVAARATAGRRRTVRLKEQFGPEYQRAVGETGDQRAAENELVARERKRSKLDIVPLSPETHERYAKDWRAVQTAFVDDPSSAVGQADRLVTQVMRERGYPIDDFDQRAADISVDHPDVVENYRVAHGIHLSQARSDVGTEKQREAFVYYRALFDKLLETESDKTKEAKA